MHGMFHNAFELELEEKRPLPPAGTSAEERKLREFIAAQ